MDGSWIAWTGALVSALSALVSVVSVVTTTSEARRARRNTEFLGHRDLWWQRWSWVVDRALADGDRERAVAAFMVRAIMTRSWSTDDDAWMEEALGDHEARVAQRQRKEHERDLGPG